MMAAATDGSGQGWQQAQAPAMNDLPVILLENAVYRWPGVAMPCLDIARFAVAPGEQVFLHGPSGSGKSTLLALLGGVLAPAAGVVRVFGADFAHTSPAARDRIRGDHIGMLFQQFNLVPYLSVLDNVLLPCRFSARRLTRAGGGRRVVDQAQRLLLGLGMQAAVWPAQAAHLSVGQQQRVAAARALIGRPELVIADEPTSALDAARQDGFIRLLMQECAAAGATLLFVSHDLRLAPLFSRSVAIDSINRAGVPVLPEIAA